MGATKDARADGTRGRRQAMPRDVTLELFEVGHDSIMAIAPAYKDKGKFEFTGKIDKVTFELTRK